LAPIAVVVEYPLLRELWRTDWLLGILPLFVRTFANVLPKGLLFSLRSRRAGFDKRAAYHALFSRALGFLPPWTLPGHDTDEAFARERLDGPNPIVIERVRDANELRARLPISDDELGRAVGASVTVAGEIAAGNMFVCDYVLLQRALLPRDQPWTAPLGRDSRFRLKYLPAPVALFCRPAGQPNLLPVAIRVDQPNARGPNPRYLRGEPGWQLAKLYVRVADSNHHELSSHNYRHHFVGGVFAAATRRQLSTNHPVHVLLEAHIDGTLMIFRLLTTPGSTDDQAFAGDLEEIQQIVIEAHACRSWRELTLENDVRRRGMERHADYPWWEDARLWRAPIDTFVREVLSQFYPDDRAVQDDPELQAWFEELCDPDRGNLRELADDGRLATVDALARLLGELLFLVGPSHASMHYPLSDFWSWVPGCPRAAYRPPPERPVENEDDRILETLAPIGDAAAQFAVSQLAGFRDQCFGDYARYRLGRLPQAAPALRRLHAGRDAIAATIDERNRRRFRPYRYLHPSQVPNSTNI
jgi:arachidonate 15-lipoxygenase